MLLRSAFTTQSTPLPRLLVILNSLCRPLLELLGFLVCLFNRLTDLALLLPRLDSHGNVPSCALAGGFANRAFGVFPVRGTGADLIPVEFRLVHVGNRSKNTEGKNVLV
jgi:hypothetical protein